MQLRTSDNNCFSTGLDDLKLPRYPPADPELELLMGTVDVGGM